MTNYRDAGDNLLADAVRYKKLWHEVRSETERQAALIAEQQLELIAGRVRTRLRRLEDFHHYIGTEAVLHIDGRLDYRKVDLLVSDLLRRRPELSARPNPDVRALEYNQGDGAKVNDLL